MEMLSTIAVGPTESEEVGLMTVVWSGLTIGAIYALVATGYNIVFISQKTFNFAQAALMMFGTFIAYLAMVTFELPWWVAAISATVIVAALAAIQERVSIRPVKDPHNLLVTTLGVSIILQGVAQLIWGGEPHGMSFFGGNEVLEVFGGRVYPVELTIIAVTLLIVIGLVVFSQRSLLGIALLGMSENTEAATLRGVNVRRFAFFSFVFAGALAGALAVFVGPKTYAVATLGAALAIKGFVVLAIGGFGSIPGVLVGGTVVGLTESLVSRYVGADFASISVFLILILILMVKPTGLFARRVERTV